MPHPDSVIANIFESMLDYDYLARPLGSAPRTLEALPLVQDGGRTYIARSRRHSLRPDPAFKGRPRELTRGRLRLRIQARTSIPAASPWAWLLEGKLVGGDEAQSGRERKAGSTTTRRCPGSRSSTAIR